jgi:hypothetical protein
VTDQRPGGSQAYRAEAADADNELRERPIGDLFSKLSAETSTLIRQEMALARAELTQKGKEAGKGAGLFGGAGAVGLLGAGAITAGIILLLDLAIAAWLAAIIVGLIYVAIAAFLGLRGRDRIQAATPPVPEETVETVKEDVEWAKTRASSAQR